mmetsp:Transcript_1423/g.3305  ORF Transcript_1423/g.3305 Transcript_1423/m.3305 type:complete len:342 (+) Transcript_1423:63-1088(+)
MALRGAVMKNLPSTISFRSRAWLQWLGFEATIPGSPLAAKGTSKDTGWLASAFLALLICLAIAAFCWMQRRERIVEQYAEEESRMRNTIAEAQASIDQQVDLEIAAASAASGSSFAATAAALPRPSTGNALNQPLPSKPKVSLPGCGPLPGNEGTSRASFAATARRSVIQRRSTDEYMLGDSSFMTVASAAPRDAAHVEAGRGSTSTRKSVSSTAAEARRKSVAELAESRKSLVEVMQMYGPDEEEAADVKVNRTSLSGWYTDEKDKPEDEAAAARERSLSSWYASEQERRVSVDPAKVVSLKEDGGGEVTVPSGVAHNLTEEATAAASEETATSAQGAAQ